jgi:hypothetical protein
MPDIPLCSVADTIVELATSIARASPDCADKAMQIADLARELDRVPDRAAIQDAIEMNLVDTNLSDPKIQTTTSAVIDAMSRAEADRV